MSTQAEGRHALIVAIAQYSDAKLRQLRAPAADAERLGEVLRDPEKGNFDVEVLLDTSHAVLTRRIASFFRDRRPTDLLLLHFSCHGVKDDRGELFLAAADTEVDLLSATGVSAAWLSDQISRTRSRRTVVLLDCCFSGSFPFGMKPRGFGVDAPEQLQGRGRAIITASNAMEYAYEGDQLTGEGQPSIFTAAVVEGLATGKADLDQDQWVSVDDLYNYVYDRVKEATPSQTPNKKSELEGPLYLARSAYRPEVAPATLDADLIARTEDRYAGIREGAVQELGELLSSRDPAVALAARQALTHMLADDSRRVSARAEAALAEAERAEQEPVEAEPARSSTPSWFRRRARLAIPVALVAVVAFAAVLLTRDSGDDGATSGSSTPTPELAAIPQANPCERTSDGWMLTDLGAEEHHECELTTSPPPEDLERPSLAYGLFSSADMAREQFDESLQFEYKEAGRPCRQSIARQMQDLLPGGDAVCFANDEYIAMWWIPDRSRVLGVLDFGLGTKLENAVGAWERVVSSE